MLKKFHHEALEHAGDKFEEDFGDCQGPEEDPIPPPVEDPLLPAGWMPISDDEV